MPNSSFREAFLHYIWQYQKFDKTDLFTTDGEKLTILSPGFVNKNAGPDFYNCRLIIKEIEWHGTIEIHYKSSDWNYHSHISDKAYNNVILHLVWDKDIEVEREDGTRIPTLELKNRVDIGLITKYKSLVDNDLALPCSNLVSNIEQLFILSMLEKTIVERMESKSNEILQILENTRNDWEETCYQWIGKCFGFKVNSDPFLQLCRLLPYSIIKRYQNKPTQIEALVYGVAGFLDDESSETYFQSLKQEFAYLSQKHSIHECVNHSEWKFLRLRPANFPTIRLAQFVAFLNGITSLYDFVFDNSASESDYSKILKSRPNTFWNSHYHFKQISSDKLDAKIGNGSVENIIVNAIIPLRFAHAAYLNVEDEKELALEVLKKIKPEKNAILAKFSALNLKIYSCYESQALIQLHNQYCTNKRCLSCTIGNQIIQKDNKTKLVNG